MTLPVKRKLPGTPKPRERLVVQWKACVIKGPLDLSYSLPSLVLWAIRTRD